MTATVFEALPFARYDFDKHRRVILQLRNAGDPRNEQLANLLESCASGQRCRSGAYLLCERELQLAIFELLDQQIRTPARSTMRGRMSAVTIMTIAAALNTIGHLPGGAGFDFLFNEDEEGELPSHWSAHGQAASSDGLSKQQREVVRATVTPTAWVKRRSRIDTLDGRANATLYAVKPDRNREVGYLDHTKARNGGAPFRNTHRRQPEQAVVLAQVEYAIGLRNRLPIKGIRQDAFASVLVAVYWAQDGPQRFNLWGERPSS